MIAITDIVEAILATICVMIFFDIHDTERGSIKNWRSMAGSVFTCFGMLISEAFVENLYIKAVVMVCFITIAMFVWKQFRIIRIFYLSWYYCFIFFSACAIRDLIRDSVWGAFGEKTIGYVISEILFRTFLILAVVGVALINRSYKNVISLSRQWFSFFLIILNAILLLLERVGEADINQNTRNFLLVWHLLWISGSGYLLLTDYGRKQVEYLSDRFGGKLAEEVRNTDLEGIVISQRKKAHEYRNHIYCIYYLAQMDGCKTVMEYVEGLNYGMYESEPVVFSTGIPAADVILSAKYKDAQLADVDISIAAEILRRGIIRNEDLVVLLSNLLNNATEAAAACQGDKIIRAEVRMVGEQLNIKVYNTHSNIIREKCGNICTTKSRENNEHGYGFINIKETVSRYNGKCNITYNEHEFWVDILI